MGSLCARLGAVGEGGGGLLMRLAFGEVGYGVLVARRWRFGRGVEPL